jgi:hypothetical protein
MIVSEYRLGIEGPQGFAPKLAKWALLPRAPRLRARPFYQLGGLPLVKARPPKLMVPTPGGGASWSDLGAKPRLLPTPVDIVA